MPSTVINASTVAGATNSANLNIAFDIKDPGFLDNSYNIITCTNVLGVLLDGLFLANGNANFGDERHEH